MKNQIVFILCIKILSIYTQYIPYASDNKPTFKAYNSLNNNNIIVLERKVNNYLKILDILDNFKIVFHGNNDPINVYIAPHIGRYRVISNLNTFIDIEVKIMMVTYEYKKSDTILNNTIQDKVYYIEVVLKSNCSYIDIKFPYENDKFLNIYRSIEMYTNVKISELYKEMKYCIDLVFIIHKKNLNTVLYSIISEEKPIYYLANQYCNLCHETIDNISPYLYVFQTHLGSKGVNFDKYSKLTNNIDAEDIVIHWIDGGYIHHEDLDNEDIMYIVKKDIRNKNFKSINHGMASLGIMKAIRNNIGVTGIASKAKIMVYGFLDFDEIFKYVKPGDIVGINVGFDILNKTNNKITDYPVSVHAYIKYRINKLLNFGVIVVAAGGNGNHNMSADDYMDVYIKDLILVGAVNIDNSKTDFSNYNHPNLIVSTWGYNLITSGYGDLYYNIVKNSNYTTIFSGTSAATPVITAIIASMQSYVKKYFNKFLTAEDVINLIQINTVKTQNTGFVPNMVTMLNHLKSKYFYNKYINF